MLRYRVKKEGALSFGGAPKAQIKLNRREVWWPKTYGGDFLTLEHGSTTIIIDRETFNKHFAEERG